MALSFLQVVVASALNLEMEYGVLLVIYTLTATATLALLFVHRETMPFLVPAGAGRRGVTLPPSPAVVAGGGPPRRWTSAVDTPFGAARPMDEPVRAMLNRGLALLVLVIGLGTLLASIVLFFFFPRFYESGWESLEAGQRVTGFSQQVSLNEIGELLESPELAMTVQFYSPPASRTPYTLQEEPYFRGSVLLRYEPFRGRWVQRGVSSSQRHFTRLEQPPALADMVRQRIVLQPQRTNTLFAVSPAYQIQATPPVIWFDPEGQVLVRDEKVTDRFEYALDTSGLRDGRQLPVTPVFQDHSDSRRYLNVFLNDELAAVLRDKSLEILRLAGVSADDPYASGKALERYLGTSGEYRYSLSSTERIPEGRDPIVEFIRSRKAGHCEHFATP